MSVARLMMMMMTVVVVVLVFGAIGSQLVNAEENFGGFSSVTFTMFRPVVRINRLRIENCWAIE